MTNLLKNENQPSNQIESKWALSKFWENREKIRIVTGDGYIHIQIATQKIWQRLFHAICSFLKLGRDREFMQVKEDYAISGDLNPLQKKRIQDVLEAQNNKSLKELRLEVAKSLQEMRPEIYKAKQQVKIQPSPPLPEPAPTPPEPVITDVVVIDEPVIEEPVVEEPVVEEPVQAPSDPQVVEQPQVDVDEPPPVPVSPTPTVIKPKPKTEPEEGFLSAGMKKVAAVVAGVAAAVIAGIVLSQGGRMGQEPSDNPLVQGGQLYPNGTILYPTFETYPIPSPIIFGPPIEVVNDVAVEKIANALTFYNPECAVNENPGEGADIEPFYKQEEHVLVEFPKLPEHGPSLYPMSWPRDRPHFYSDITTLLNEANKAEDFTASVAIAEGLEKGFDALIEKFDFVYENMGKDVDNVIKGSSHEKQLFSEVYKMYLYRGVYSRLPQNVTPDLNRKYEFHKNNALKLSRGRERAFVEQLDVYLKAQAFGISLDDIPLTTISNGKTVLKRLDKEIDTLIDDIKEQLETTENSHSVTILNEQLAKLHDMKYFELGQIINQTPASSLVTSAAKNKLWFNKIARFRSSFPIEKAAIEDAITYEKYRDRISLSKLRAFMNTPAIPANDLVIAQAFGTNFLYGLPMDKVDTLSVMEYRLNTLRAWIQSVKADTLCTDKEADTFCSHFIGNPSFAKRVRHADTMSYLKKLEGKLGDARQLTETLATGEQQFFESLLKDKVNALSSNDSLFFSDNKLGLVYEVVKQPLSVAGVINTYCTVRIFDTDPRHELQTVIIEGGREKMHAFREISDIKLSSLVDGTLWEHQYGTPSAKEVYDKFLKATEGVPHKEAGGKELVQVAQNSYYQTLSAFFATQAEDVRHATQFDFEAKTKLMYDAYNEIINTGTSSYDLTVLRNANANFAADIAKWTDSEAISADEGAYAASLSNRLLREVKSLRITQLERDQTILSPSQQVTGSAVMMSPVDLPEVAMVKPIEKFSEKENGVIDFNIWWGNTATLLNDFNDVIFDYKKKETKGLIHDLMPNLDFISDYGEELKHKNKSQKDFERLESVATQLTKILREDFYPDKLQDCRSRLEIFKTTAKTQLYVLKSEDNEFREHLKEITQSDTYAELWYIKSVRILENLYNEVNLAETRLDILSKLKAFDQFPILKQFLTRELWLDNHGMTFPDVGLSKPAEPKDHLTNHMLLKSMDEFTELLCLSNLNKRTIFDMFISLRKLSNYRDSLNFQDRYRRAFKTPVVNNKEFDDQMRKAERHADDTDTFLRYVSLTMNSLMQVIFENIEEETVVSVEEKLYDSLENIKLFIKHDFIKTSVSTEEERVERIAYLTKKLGKLIPYRETDDNLLSIYDLDVYTPLGKASWDGQPQTTVEHISNISKALNQDALGAPGALVSDVQDVIRNLPLDEKFWDELPVEDASKMLDALAKLSTDYNKHLFARKQLESAEIRRTDKLMEPQDYLPRLKILAITNQLLNHPKFRLLEKPISLWSPVIGKFFDEKVSTRLKVEPKIYMTQPWSMEYHHLKQYWNEMENSSYAKMHTPSEIVDSMIFGTLPQPKVDDFEWAAGYVRDHKDELMQYAEDELYRPQDVRHTRRVWSNEKRKTYWSIEPNLFYHVYGNGNVYVVDISINPLVYLKNTYREINEKIDAKIDAYNRANILEKIYGITVLTFQALRERRLMEVKTKKPTQIMPKAYRQAEEIFLGTCYFPFDENGVLNAAVNQDFSVFLKDDLIFYYVPPDAWTRLKGEENDLRFNVEKDVDTFYKNTFGKEMSYDTPPALLALSGRMPPNNIAQVARRFADHFEDNFNIKESDLRNLLMLHSNSATQVQDTLSYFTKNVALLSSRQYRETMKFLMFESDLFFQEFQSKMPRDNREFANDLMAFCKNSVTYFEKIKDYQAISSMLEFTHRVNASLEAFSKAYPEKLSPDVINKFYDARGKLRELLRRKDISPDAKALLYNDLAKTYVSNQSLKHEEAIEFVSTIIRAGIRKPRKEWIENPVKDALIMSKLPQEKSDMVKVLLTGDDRLDILNGIYHQFFPEAQALVWKNDSLFPVYSTEDGSVEINIVEGTFKEAGAALAQVPENILAHPGFVEIFGQRNEMVGTQVQGAGQVFITRGPQGRQYRLIMEGKDSLTIQTEFEGRWYQQTKDESLIASMDLPKAVTYENQCWYSADPNSPILWLNATTGAGRYAVSDGEIYKLDRKGQRTSEVAVKPDEATPIGKMVFALEDPEWSIVFKDKNSGALRSFSLPRLGLDFEMDEVGDEMRHKCVQFPDKYLAQQQSVSQLSHVRNYLVLENAAKAKSVIMPMPVALKEKEAGIAVSKSFFDVDPINQNLIPRSDSERIHLAYLALMQRNPEGANLILKPLSMQTEPLSKDSMHLLRRISELPVKQTGADPRTYAVKLKAIAMLMRNSQDLMVETEVQFTDTEAEVQLDAYARYLQSDDKRPLEILSQDDERLLLRSLSLFIDTISHPNQHRIIDRMYELGIPLSDDVLTMSKFMPIVDQLEQGKQLRYGQIKNDDMNFVLSDDFIDDYELLRNIENNQKVSDEQIKDFAHKYIHEGTVFDLVKTFITKRQMPIRFMSRDMVIDKLQESMRSSMADKSVPDQLKLLTYFAVMNHPEKFPGSFSILKTMKDDEKTEWVEKKFTRPLRKLILSGSKIQSLLAPLPPKIADSPKMSLPSDAPVKWTFDFSKLKHVDEIPLAVAPSSIVKQVESSTSKMTKIHKVIEATKTKLKNPLAQAGLDGLAAQAQLITKKGVTTAYKIIDEKSLFDARETLRRDSRELNQKLVVWKKTVEDIANKSVLTKAQRAIMQANMIAGRDRPIQIEELLLNLLTHDISDLKIHNPELTDVEIEAIYQGVMEYLTIATQKQHQEVVEKQMSIVLDSIESEVSKMELEEKVGVLADLMKRSRGYDAKEHPEMLVLENAVGYRFKPSQINVIHELKIVDGVVTRPEHIGVVCEAIPGFGKTSVVIPVHGSMNADGESLAVVVMPKVLIKSMSKELQVRYGDAYGRKVEEMEFNRDMCFTKETLTRVVDRLTDIRDNKKLLLISSESLQAFTLKMAEKVGEYNHALANGKDATEVGEEVELFFEVFRRFKETGKVMYDEIDSLLDVLKSFHFTLGKPSNMYLVPGEAATELYTFMLSKPELRTTLLPLVSGTKSTFTDATYEKEIKPLLIKGVLNGEVGTDETQDFIKNLNESDKSKLERFLNGDFSEDVKEITDSIEDEKLQDSLATYSEQINKLLHLTLPKQLQGHFGPQLIQSSSARNYRDGVQQFLLGIPYRLGRRSSPGTQFGTELEIVNYSLQMYAEVGYSPDQMVFVLGALKERIAMSLRDNPSLPLEEIPEYSFFVQSFDPEKKYNILELVPSYETLKKASEANISLKDTVSNFEEVVDITKFVNEDSEKVLDIFQKVILPEMKIFPRQLNADAQLFGILFKQMQGFSGTLWNVDTFAKSFSKVILSDTDARTLALVWNDDPVGVIDTVKPSNEQSIKDAIEKIVTTKSNRPASIIDAANIFGGIPNEEMCRLMLVVAKEKGWDTEGCVHYDPEDRMMVLSQTKDGWKSTPKAESKIPKDKLISYWGQSHSRGSDIPMSPTMEAGVTVGRFTYLVDFVQGVHRLRMLSSTQNVHFVTTEENNRIISELVEQQTGQMPKENLTMQELMVFLVSNQAKRQGDDNYRSFKQKIRAVALEKVIEAMITPRSSITFGEKEISGTEASANIYTIAMELFENVQERRPYKLYVHPTVEQTKENVVKADIEEFLNGEMMNKIRSHYILGEYADEIESKVRALAVSEIDRLPPKIEQAANYNRERSVQTEKQSEEEQQKEINMSINIKRDKSKGSDNVSADSIIPIPEQFWPKPVGVLDWNYFDDNAKSMLSMNQVLDGVLKNAKDSPFSPDLLCSENLCPVNYRPSYLDLFMLGDTKDAKILYEPYGLHHKEFYQVLVIKDLKSGKLKTMMIDTNDEKQWKSMLLQNDQYLKEHPDVKNNIQVVLYDLHKGTYMQSSERNWIPRGELEKDPAFRTLLAQVKFARGDIHYTKQEEYDLHDWLSSVDTAAMKDLFIKKIMPWRDIDESKLNNSALGRKLNKVRKVVEEGYFTKLFKSFFGSKDVKPVKQIPKIVPVESNLDETL